MAENPYQYSTPVSDPERFAGRTEALAFLQTHLVGGHQRRVPVILGAAQMGKSSLLRQIPEHLDPHYCPIRLSLRAGTVAGEQAWLSALAATIPQALEILDIQSARLPTLPAEPDALRKALLGDYMTEGLHAMRQGRHLLLLVDNAERLLHAVGRSLPEDSFTFLAALLEEHAHFDMVMAFDARYEQDVLAVGLPFDPALIYRLGRLPRHEADALLTGPAAGTLIYTPEALDAIFDLAAGHPYLTQLMGWLLFEQADKTGSGEVGAADVEAVIEMALGMAGDTLGAAWTGGTPQDRLVLTALSVLSQGEPPTPVPPDDIGAWLIAAENPLEPRTVNAIWRRLEYEDVLRLEDGRLIINGGLQRRWLREHVMLPGKARRAYWRRVILVGVVAVLVLAVLLAILSSLPGPGTASDGGSDATITLDLGLQATDDAYNATQTAVAR